MEADIYIKSDFKCVIFGYKLSEDQGVYKYHGFGSHIKRDVEYETFLRNAVNELAHELELRNIKSVNIITSGPLGPHKLFSILQEKSINVKFIKDITPIPHNGCRVRKRRSDFMIP